MGKHYLYRHIRLDSNEPFYIGIGTKPSRNYVSYKVEYGRAHNKIKRSSFWKGVINKTDYEIEILFESDDYEFIKQKEIEFITLHGRRDFGLGTLVNLTNGGDGTIGSMFSKESRDRYSLAKTGENNVTSKLLLSLETGIYYGSIIEASKIYGMSFSYLSAMLKGDRRNTTDLVYAESENNGIYPIIPKIKPQYVAQKRSEEYKSTQSKNRRSADIYNSILLIDTANGIFYKNAREAAEAYNISTALMHWRIKNKKTSIIVA